ncbi:TerB family tellurite resistance protein [Arenicella chitinivorans]|nr:TerB family tellurite resistance protein [Arenicella chitinivorans]
MKPTIPPKAALLLATITITAIDGELDAHEMAIINRLDGFKTTDDWNTAIAVWNDTPLEDCIPLVAASLDEKQQRIAMANMFDIAMADGYLDEAENLLLRAYANTFEVSEADIEKIVDVITIKNDRSKF